MSNPRHAFETDNGRYYHIPGVEQELVSVTNAISVGLSKFGLPLWYANSAVAAAWDEVPAMVGALRRPLCGFKNDYDPKPGEEPCRLCRDCLSRRIAKAAEEKRDSAAFLGTRVHELAEAHILGRTLTPQEGDDEAVDYVWQYMNFLRDYDVQLERDVVGAEATVFHKELGYAGTGDIWLRLPFDGFLWKDGKLVLPKKIDDPAERGTILIDIKTSRTRAATQSYPENVMQLAALRHARDLLLPDDTVVPNIRVRGAATLQLRAKGYALIPLPADTREFNLFRNVLNLANWLHNEWPGNFDYRPLLPSGKTKPKRNTKEKE